MIITSVKHGRTSRDGVNLIRHLLKPENDYVHVARIGNSFAPDLFELALEMELYRDASPSLAAFHHLTINPARNLARPQLLAAAEQVRLELDPDGVRPYAIVVHGKKRAEKGGANEHAHVVLGHVSSTGKALRDSWVKIRTERVARELEFAYGEPATLGRHHKAVLKVLQKHSPNVAAWLTRAFGQEPPKPTSSLTPGSRSRALKNDFNLPAAKATLRQLLAEGNGLADFRPRLEGAGYTIKPGEKRGVFVISDPNGYVIGAADRLLKVRRATFKTMMEYSVEGPRNLVRSVGHSPRPAALPSRPEHREEAGPAPSPAGRIRGSRSGRARELAPGPSPDHSGGAGARAFDAGVSSVRDPGPRPEAIPHVGAIARRRALMRLRRANAARLAMVLSVGAEYAPPPPDLSPPEPSPTEIDYVARTDMWGVGILKPRGPA